MFLSAAAGPRRRLRRACSAVGAALQTLLRRREMPLHLLALALLLQSSTPSNAYVISTGASRLAISAERDDNSASVSASVGVGGPGSLGSNNLAFHRLRHQPPPPPPPPRLIPQTTLAPAQEYGDEYFYMNDEPSRIPQHESETVRDLGDRASEHFQQRLLQDDEEDEEPALKLFRSQAEVKHEPVYYYRLMFSVFDLDDDGVIGYKEWVYVNELFDKLTRNRFD